MIFYEAPHKLKYTLADMAEAFGGERGLVIAREITKEHEEYLHLTLSEAAALYDETPPKGEFVLIIRGAEPARESETGAVSAELLTDALIRENIKGKSAARIVSAALNIPKNKAYEIYLSRSGSTC